jgi:hypothetical protein
MPPAQLALAQATLDSIRCRGGSPSGSFSFDLNLARDTANFELVKAGWKTDHRAICRWALLESKDDPKGIRTAVSGYVRNVMKNFRAAQTFFHHRMLQTVLSQWIHARVSEKEQEITLCPRGLTQEEDAQFGCPRGQTVLAS